MLFPPQTSLTPEIESPIRKHEIATNMFKQPYYKEEIRTGHLTSKFVGDLKNSISNYVTWHNGFYIGITNRPKERNLEHAQYGKNHSEMVVIFQTSSISVCKNLEAILIDYYKNNEKYCDLNFNSIAGGGGNFAETGPYFLYILLWD